MNTLDFRYSRDGGRNHSAFRQIPMGETGDFCEPIITYRLGQGRQWVFDIRVTDPVRCDILAASIQIEGEG